MTVLVLITVWVEGPQQENILHLGGLGKLATNAWCLGIQVRIITTVDASRLEVNDKSESFPSSVIRYKFSSTESD